MTNRMFRSMAAATALSAASIWTQSLISARIMGKLHLIPPVYTLARLAQIYHEGTRADRPCMRVVRPTSSRLQFAACTFARVGFSCLLSNCCWRSPSVSVTG
jgi:hypothetical protein